MHYVPHSCHICHEGWGSRNQNLQMDIDELAAENGTRIRSDNNANAMAPTSHVRVSMGLGELHSEKMEKVALNIFHL